MRPLSRSDGGAATRLNRRGPVEFLQQTNLNARIDLSRSLLFLKAEQLAAADENLDLADLDHAFGKDGAAKRARAASKVARWMEQHVPNVRETSTLPEPPFAEDVLRVNCFLRNLTRTRANYSSVELGMDMFDHAPLFRRPGGETSVGGAPTIFPAEKPGSRHTRSTVVAPGATDATTKPPTGLPEAKEPTENRDFQDVAATAGKQVSPQYGPAATYAFELNLKFVNNLPPTSTPIAFLTRTPRILVMDQFRGLITMEVLRRARELNRAILRAPGGSTGLL